MICASIRESKMSEVLRKLAELPDIYDLVEIWVNEIDDLDWGKVVDICGLPFLAKFTENDDVGLVREVLRSNVKFVENDEKFACKVLRSNVKFVDFDMDTPTSVLNMVLNELKEHKETKLILSYHDFNGTPSFEEATAILDNMKNVVGYGDLSSKNELNDETSDRKNKDSIVENFKTSKDKVVFKLVFTAQKIEDNLVPLRMLIENMDVREDLVQQQSMAENSNLKENLVSFCMGNIGKMSRTYASKFGSLINFVAPDESWKTADGQLILKEWQEL